MLNTITILLLHIAAMLGFSAYPNDINDDIEGMLKLANYASWQNDQPEIRIVMAPGSEESYKEVSSLLKNKRLNDKNIILERYSSNMDLDGCHILFIEDGAGIDVEQITSGINNLKILTISNNYDNLDLGCMFYIKCTDGTFDYKYNKNAVINSGLVIKSSALSPAHCYN